MLASTAQHWRAPLQWQTLHHQGLVAFLITHMTGERTHRARFLQLPGNGQPRASWVLTITRMCCIPANQAALTTGCRLGKRAFYWMTSLRLLLQQHDSRVYRTPWVHRAGGPHVYRTPWVHRAGGPHVYRTPWVHRAA